MHDQFAGTWKLNPGKSQFGSVAGEGSYVVADDGRTMTATTAGFDSQLRRFEMRTVWDRA